MDVSRRVAAALTVALLACAAGCTGAADDRRAGAVALLVAGRQFGFVQEMTFGFAHGVDEVGGVAHTESGPGVADSAAQLEQFHAAEQASPASLAVFTLTPELFADSIGSAITRGTPVISVHAPPAPGSGVRLFVGNDNYRLGAMLGEAVAARLPATTGGVIVIGSVSPGIPSLDSRVAGVRDTLHRLLPTVVVVGPFDTKQEPGANLRAWQTLHRANPGALALIGVGGRDANSIAALRAAGHDPWVAGAIGFDDSSLTLAAKGRMVLVSTETYLQGQVAGRLQALAAKTGRPLPIGWIQTPGLLIDDRNAAAIIARQFSEARRQQWFRDMADTIVHAPEQFLRPLEDAV
ncbi:sugar ABC transporter substrate-binding protein [Catenuloplanes atrovinosus]|uniref:Ribose transport system substrate-binding protein n=1 Tax=Catenuloplanes atrovinosus TaxID=137266 RepID=A0AAE3YNA9_9ACTN|nr:substrate-binding domain-containing protein [Catenuloplanes atrovinosus]MDR7276680.1 ribose transport system substrate-binding protein [Catenuloplanes atrovinosus]